MMHERERSRESASTISGKRRVKSLPGTAVERYPFAVLAGDDAEAVMLRLSGA
jgi:hypothetical protein